MDYRALGVKYAVMNCYIGQCSCSDLENLAGVVGTLDCRCSESLFPTTTYQLGRFLGQLQHSSTSSDTKSPTCQPIARCPVAAEFRTPGGAQSGTETGAGRSHRGRYRLHQPMAHRGHFVWDRKKKKATDLPPGVAAGGFIGFYSLGRSFGQGGPTDGQLWATLGTPRQQPRRSETPCHMRSRLLSLQGTTPATRSRSVVRSRRRQRVYF